MQQAIEVLIRRILSEKIDNLEVSAESLQSNDDLTLHGMNSLSYVRILVALEDEFDIEFEDDEMLLDSLNTLEKLIALVVRKKGMEQQVSN